MSTRHLGLFADSDVNISGIYEAVTVAESVTTPLIYAARYSNAWRINITSVNGANNIFIPEIQMRSTIGGADQCSGGTVYYSNQSGSYPAVDAFDNSYFTMWSTTSGVTSAWIQYTFTSVINIKEYTIQCYQNFNDYCPNDFTFQYYNLETSEWNTVDTRIDETNWVNAEVRVFEVGTLKVNKYESTTVTDVGTAGFAYVNISGIYETVTISELVSSGLSDLDFLAFDIATVNEYSNMFLTGTALAGSVVWGHDTDVDETNVENLSTWVGTGEASGSGDDEIITLITEQYMDSPDVYISGMVTLAWNKYKAGNDPTVKYKTTAAQGDLDAAEWIDYTDQFLSLGWVRVRIEE